MFEEQDPILNRLAQRRRSLGDTVGGMLTILGGGKPPAQEPGNDLYTKLALLNYKAQLQPQKASAVEDGYAPGQDIPQEMGGLPLKDIKVGKGGYRIPTYGQASGMFDPADIQNDPSAGLQGPDYLKYLEDTNPNEARTVQGIANYEIDPTTMFAGMKGAAARAKYIQEAKHLDPTYNSMEFPARSKYLTDVKSGKIRQNITSLNTATKHLNSLRDAMAPLASTNVPVWNKIQNWYMRQTGKAAPADVDAALNAVSGELATIFKNTSGTDQEIESWKNSFDPNASQAQKMAFLNRGIDLMEGRLTSLEDQYSSTMGKEPPKGMFISPDSMRIMEQLRRQPLQPPQQQTGQKRQAGRFIIEEGQ